MSTSLFVPYSDFTTSFPKPETPEQYEAVSNVLLIEMRQINEGIAANRIEMARIDAENKALKAETQSLLTKLMVAR